MRICLVTLILYSFGSVINSEDPNTTEGENFVTSTHNSSSVERVGGVAGGGPGGAGAVNTDCVWDAASLTKDNELCEEDFAPDDFGCLKIENLPKLKKHKGKREFGQKCSVSSDNEEEACLLLAPGTKWRYKEYSVDPNTKRNFQISNCTRRTNLVCHGFYSRCYCSTKDNPGEYYQYDKGQKVCVIRPGFPCKNEYDCSNGTICNPVFADEGQWEYVCGCDHRLEYSPGSIDTSEWDNWHCYDENDPTRLHREKKKKVEFGFNSKSIKRLSSASATDNTNIWTIFLLIVVSFVNIKA